MKFCEKDTDYPREFFQSLINNDSPYAWYIFQWIDYNGEARRWRLKMPHDLKLSDGRILKDMHPNANAWHCDNKIIDDDEVIQIRLSRTIPWIDKEWKDPRKT